MDDLTDKQRNNLEEFISIINNLPMTKKQKIEFIKNLSFEEMKNGLSKIEILEDEEKKPFFRQNGEDDDREAELLFVTDKTRTIDEKKDI